MRQDFVELGATDLKRGFDSGRPRESKLCTVHLSKTAFPGTKRRLAVFKIVWQIV
jgi:hypothetical protein